MASCLGLYIENNLIKYAKVSTSNETVKVESFGIKFYENLESTIKQIIEETYSFKIPISINLTDEIYTKFEVFSMLSKKDINEVIKTEFESICYDKGVNNNIYEQRHILANLNNRGEKIKIIHIAATKTSIVQRKNQLMNNRVNSISPIGITIPNLIEKGKKSTVLIVNIEKNTTITKVSNNNISDVTIIPFGAQDILKKIKEKENSYSKAYEICKNTTIYTEEDKDLQYQENEYLPDIMPTLFKIVTEVEKVIKETFESIETVYITGTISAINNIDIYFQEYLKNVHCEILKPKFINNNSKINIKDYIEVNSAISIGLQGLEKNNDVNFVKESFFQKTVQILKSDISNSNFNINMQDINNFFQKFDRQYNIIFFTIILLFVVYTMGCFIINKKLDTKIENTVSSINTTNDEIKILQDYTNRFNEQNTTYKKMIANIEDTNNNNSKDKRYKNTIPNLLNNVMAVIPKQVQLVSIENTSDTHIVITAKSTKYEQIAYFKTKLKTEEILKNIVSDTGTMQSQSLVVTIEGELP